MGKQRRQQGNNDHLKVVHAQQDNHVQEIVQSLTSLLYEEEVDQKTMLTLLCRGIMGLTTTTVKHHELTRNGQKEELTVFVEREMERVRKANASKRPQ